MDDVGNTYSKLSNLNKDINEAKGNSKYGKVQQLLYTRKYLYRKLLSYKQKFNSILKGYICKIKYEYKLQDGNIETSEAILVNMSDEEIYDTIQLFCKFHGYNFIKVLEIKRIPTKLR